MFLKADGQPPFWAEYTCSESSMDNYKFPLAHIQAVVLLSCDIFFEHHSDRREPKSGACIHFFHGVAHSQGDFLK